MVTELRRRRISSHSPPVPPKRACPSTVQRSYAPRRSSTGTSGPAARSSGVPPPARAPSRRPRRARTTLRGASCLVGSAVVRVVVERLEGRAWRERWRERWREARARSAATTRGRAGGIADLNEDEADHRSAVLSWCALLGFLRLRSKPLVP